MIQDELFTSFPSARQHIYPHNFPENTHPPLKESFGFQRYLR